MRQTITTRVLYCKIPTKRCDGLTQATLSFLFHPSASCSILLSLSAVTVIRPMHSNSCSPSMSLGGLLSSASACSNEACRKVDC